MGAPDHVATAGIKHQIRRVGSPLVGRVAVLLATPAKRYAACRMVSSPSVSKTVICQDCHHNNDDTLEANERGQQRALGSLLAGFGHV